MDRCTVGEVLFGVFASFLLGAVVAAVITVDACRRGAVEAGAGTYIVNPKTGGVRFEYISRVAEKE